MYSESSASTLTAIACVSWRLPAEIPSIVQTHRQVLPLGSPFAEKPGIAGQIHHPQTCTVASLFVHTLNPAQGFPIEAHC